MVYDKDKLCFSIAIFAITIVIIILQIEKEMYVAVQKLILIGCHISFHWS